MPQLITHKRPHLDDIAAFWLLRKFRPELAEATLEFVEYGEVVPTGDDVIAVGVGRGEFDEHKGDTEDCATTLVWKKLKAEGRVADGAERQALEKLIDWVRLEDLGLLRAVELREFTVPALLTWHYANHGSDSAELCRFGFGLLDDALASQRDWMEISADWERRKEFESIYGPAVAFLSSGKATDSFAYARGFKLVITIDPEKRRHSLTAQAGSGINLEPVYRQIVAIEPGADWFLHHSKQLLLAGKSGTPGAQPSRLTLEWIVDLLTPNYVRVAGVESGEAGGGQLAAGSAETA